MLNILPWRQVVLQRERKKFCIFLLILLVSTNSIALCMRHWILLKCCALDNERIGIIKKIESQVSIKNDLQYQLASSRMVTNWYRAMQLQNKYFNFLENLPDLLPTNSYLNRLSLDRDELILEGAVLRSSEEPLTRVIQKVTLQHRFAVKRRQVEGVGASEQKFLISFICLGRS